ncbi:MAG: HAMP domain-containing histidine kinase [Clostridia bacterium]|nr:HAMP domain-containing histidine kinase [Clostridia bacterium]
MNRRSGKNFSTVWRYVVFFVIIAAIITLAVPVYDYARQRSGGDKGVMSVVMLLVILFLAGLVVLVDVIRRKLTDEKPLEQIRQATESIARGDFSVRLYMDSRFNLGGYDEIMQNLNIMAQELSKSEILKSDFIANVSHELKTPLAIIQSYCQLLQEKNLAEEERIKYAQALIQASKKLTALITNILKLNKLENQQILTDLENIKINSQLEELIVNYIEVIEEKGIELEVDLQEVTVNSVAGYLEIVWSNLLSNAIKFTDSGGKIKVSAKQIDGKAVVSVSDSGVGMTPETGNRIFEKFYQGDTSHTQEGNGLGLALVKKVIDKLGGSISVSSELGKGSTFTVTI